MSTVFLFVFQREWDEGVVCLQVCVVVFLGVGVGGGLFVYRLFFVCVFRGRGEGGCLSIGVFVCVLERGEWGAVCLQVSEGWEGISCLSDKG